MTFLKGYSSTLSRRARVKGNVGSALCGIMVGHLEVPGFEAQSGLPSSLSRNVVYDLLTRELKVRGVMFTDGWAMEGVGRKVTVNSTGIPLVMPPLMPPL